MGLKNPFVAKSLAQLVAGSFLLFSVTSLRAFNTPTHSALTIVAARDHFQSRVNDFLKNQLLETAGLETTGLVLWDVTKPPVPGSRNAVNYLGALSLGAIDEDSEQSKADTLHRLRMVHHFYDPSRNGLGLNDPDVASIGNVVGVSLPVSDALHWAWDNHRAVRTDDNPNLNFAREAEDYSWQAARRNYLFWLKHPDATERQWHAGETFYALGHVTHLLQDMAQPQHTRNDAHMPRILGGDDAPFEAYCEAHYGTVDQLSSIPRDRVPVFDKLPKDQHDGIPPEFMAFWDTHQLFGDPVYGDPSQDPMHHNDPHNLGLAEFSNAYFVTDDTMFTGKYPIAYHGYTISAEVVPVEQQVKERTTQVLLPPVDRHCKLGHDSAPDLECHHPCPNR